MDPANLERTFFNGLFLDLFVKYFKGETGLIENGTFLFLFLSLFIIICINKVLKQKKIKNFNNFQTKFFQFFLFLSFIGILYFAGEEVSWGQNWFNWKTPDFLLVLNDQSETNIHNISSWFDQKPRIIIETIIILFGFIYPLMNIIYNLRINNNLIKFLMPNCYLIPISAIFIFFYILNLVYKINGDVVSNVKPIFNINITIPTILLFRTSEILEL